MHTHLYVYYIQFLFTALFYTTLSRSPWVTVIIPLGNGKKLVNAAQHRRCFTTILWRSMLFGAVSNMWFIYLFYLCQVKIKLAQSSLNWWNLWGYIKDEKGGWCERNEIKTILGERLKQNHRGVIFHSLMFQWECFMSKCCWHCKSKFRRRF